jgi:hypothetical protein
MEIKKQGVSSAQNTTVATDYVEQDSTISAMAP